MRPDQWLSGCCMHTQAMVSSIQGGYGITGPRPALYNLAEGAEPPVLLSDLMYQIA